ncbi:hypothetical protein Acr_26g0003780 [Actinidia rufa]|uniref:Uncharacterized protein n=1 Tax=Actinidia rufa TaxID=165716 RepID=A0A7J0H259_9ERIC|nr:hypothetical protein Acr_26g0003780 [Actinidia rufa]
MGVLASDMVDDALFLRLVCTSQQFGLHARKKHCCCAVLLMMRVQKNVVGAKAELVKSSADITRLCGLKKVQLCCMRRWPGKSKLAACMLFLVIIGRGNSDECQLQMQDGLQELMIAYEVVHRLRDLFALYGRPQVEGSPFPSAILLSINLLAVLTSRTRTIYSIDLESFPIETVPENETSEANLLEALDSGCSSETKPSGDNGPQPSALEGIDVSDIQDESQRVLIDTAESSVSKDEEKYSCAIAGKQQIVF